MCGKSRKIFFLWVLFALVCAAGITAEASDSYKNYKPKIAIVYTSRPSAPTYRFIQKCGMRAYWLGPRSKKANITEYLKHFTRADVEKYDGLYVPGGGDVTPSLYGQKKRRETHGVSYRLDKLQIGIIKKFAAAGKPIMGICRGIQIINVAFGGTLCQHIPGWHTYWRNIRIKKGSFSYDLYGPTENVYHFHHQCVQKVAKGFVATEWDARDGHIEGIESKTLPIYCVQWHPESSGKKGRKYGYKFRRVCIHYKIRALEAKKKK